MSHTPPNLTKKKRKTWNEECHAKDPTQMWHYQVYKRVAFLFMGFLDEGEDVEADEGIGWHFTYHITWVSWLCTSMLASMSLKKCPNWGVFMIKNPKPWFLLRSPHPGSPNRHLRSYSYIVFQQVAHPPNPPMWYAWVLSKVSLVISISSPSIFPITLASPILNHIFPRQNHQANLTTKAQHHHRHKFKNTCIFCIPQLPWKTICIYIYMRRYNIYSH